jgi:AcrR family transcriptional regulator
VKKTHSTEEKIKLAARKVFHQKGFSASKTRDIAEEAGINLALLNYYFRSKEGLFSVVMLETFQEFIQSMGAVFNNPQTSLNEKIQLITESYLNLLQKEPEIPMFILSELRRNPEEIFEKLPVKTMFMHSVLMQQLTNEYPNRFKQATDKINFIMNLMGLIMFPFLGKPMLQMMGNLQEENFNQIIEERKKLIPMYIHVMLNNLPS